MPPGPRSEAACAEKLPDPWSAAPACYAVQPINLTPSSEVTSENSYEAAITKAVETAVGAELSVTAPLGMGGLTASFTYTLSASNTNTQR